jgi:SAM-dependent methyltransferase
VSRFVGAERFTRAIDYGCGDGSLSIPLLGQLDELVLLDTSPAMLDAARSQLGASDSSRVTFGDPRTGDWRGSGADLVLCVGILAHMDDPWRTLEEVLSLVRPGGAAVIEVSDAGHPAGWALVRYSRLRERLRPDSWAWNELKARDVLANCTRAGFSVKGSYAYGFPIPLDRFLGEETIYRLGRGVFGTPGKSAGSWLSCDRLYYLRRD